MSVILAFKKDDCIYFGADTQVTRSTEKYNYNVETDYKVQKLDNGLIFAWVGCTVAKQFILSNQEWFNFDTSKGLTKQYIVTEIVPKLYQSLKEEGLLDNKSGEMPNMGGSILLAYKDKLYEIGSTFAVIRYNDYRAIGSGSASLQYGLMRIDRKQDVNEQILKLLKISEMYNSTVSAPFVFINTKELKYTKWERNVW